ncbi:MAG: efflux RND transporter periplasmic adaptor subunit [Candidatus Zixiibacteriota bacterium]
MTKKKKLFLIIGGVVVVGGLVVANLTMNTTKTTDVQAEAVKLRSLTEVVSASGRVQPKTKVDITSQINAEVIDLRVREGDYVEAAQLLVVLDTVQLRSDVDQARYAVSEISARLDGAKNDLDQAEEEYKRQEKLYKTNLTSETAYTNAKYAYLNRRAAHEATAAQAKQSQSRYAKQLDNLSKAKINAPMAGIVTLLDCEVGEIAAAQTAFTQGKTLMTISNLDIFEVEVDVDETEIGKVDLGQEVEISIDAFPDTTFGGRVVEIGNTAIMTGLGTQDQSTNFLVNVVFTDPNVRIRPGMSATVDITTNSVDDALSVPYSAIVIRSFNVDSLERARAGTEPESSSAIVGQVHAAEADEELDKRAADGDEKDRKEYKGVFVIDDGVARFVEVNTGIADQKHIEITSGISEGDSVVSGPYRVLRRVKDGDALKPKEKKEEKS